MNPPEPNCRFILFTCLRCRGGLCLAYSQHRRTIRWIQCPYCETWHKGRGPGMRAWVPDPLFYVLMRLALGGTFPLPVSVVPDALWLCRPDPPDSPSFLAWAPDGPPP